MDWAKTTARDDEKHLSFEIWCDLYKRFNGSYYHPFNDWWWYGIIYVILNTHLCANRGGPVILNRHKTTTKYYPHPPYKHHNHHQLWPKYPYLCIAQFLQMFFEQLLNCVIVSIVFVTRVSHVKIMCHWINGLVRTLNGWNTLRYHIFPGNFSRQHHFFVKLSLATRILFDMVDETI